MTSVETSSRDGNNINMNNEQIKENEQQPKKIEFELSLQCTKCGVDFRKVFDVEDCIRLHCPYCHRILCTIIPIVGRIYVLSNPSMPDLIKIGYTTRSIDERLQELSTTNVPTPFKVEAVYSSVAPLNDEKNIQDALGKHRLLKNREFFHLAPAKAVELISRLLRRPPIEGIHSCLSTEI